MKRKSRKKINFNKIKCPTQIAITFFTVTTAFAPKNSLCRYTAVSYHGRFESKYLQDYLDEYVFRFNRRKSTFIGKKFMRIAQQAVKSAKITYAQIKWDIDPISEYFALWLYE